MKQREIKFRVWAKMSREWAMLQHEDVQDWSIEDLLDDSEDIVMQYTGLKDKNGKEIFEGDIVVKRDENALGYTRVRNCRVEWKDSWYGWGVMTEYGDGYSLQEIARTGLEIIGNIYENPELVTPNKE